MKNLSLLLFYSFILLNTCALGQGSGSTLNFNGNNQAVNLGDSVGNGIRTIELWFQLNVNIDVSNTQPQALIFRDYNYATAGSINEFGLYFGSTSLGAASGKLHFKRHIGTTKYEILSDQNTWDAFRWYHVAAVIDPVSGMKLYVNGILQSNTNSSTSATRFMSGNTSDETHLGKWGVLTIPRYFNGKLDDVRLWNTARTQTEIREYMCQRLKGNEAGLRAYYNFDIATGLNLPDLSTNSYDGTLINMTSSNWEDSGAPIGDTSEYLYNSSSGIKTLNLNRTNSDTISVSTISKGYHIYEVNESPNYSTNLPTDRDSTYFGVWQMESNLRYNLNIKSGLPCTFCNIVYTRNDNTVRNWFNVGGIRNACDVNLLNESSTGSIFRGEYIISDSGVVRILALGNDTTLCLGDSLIVDMSAYGDAFLWQDNSTNAIYTIKQPGYYEVEISSLTDSCTKISSVNVSFDTVPFIDLGKDTSLCIGDTITLSISNSNATLLWQDSSTNTFFTAYTAGLYHVTATSGFCSTSDSLEITLRTFPGANLGPDTGFCVGDSIKLVLSDTSLSYLWQDNSTDSVLTVTQGGNYWVEISNSNCLTRDSINVAEVNYPNVNFGDDTTFCDGLVYQLNAFNSNSSYLWQDSSSGPNYFVSSSGTYYVSVVKNRANCAASDTINVIVEETPFVELGEDTTLCEGDSILLNATTSAESYKWQDGSSDTVLLVKSQGIYSVVTTLGNCQDSAAILINFDSIPYFDLGENRALCEKDTAFFDVSGKGQVYNWSTGDTVPIIAIDSADKYFLTIESGVCSYTDSVRVNFNPLPQPLDQQLFTICENKTITVSANNPGSSYLWSTGETSRSITLQSTGIYQVIITSPDGCELVQPFSINRCTSYLFIPNTITPNGDGKNDTWIIRNIEAYPNNSVKIYNRNGYLLFDKSKYDNSWDGTYNGELLPETAYYYVVVLGDGDKIYRGSLNIIRQD